MGVPVYKLKASWGIPISLFILSLIVIYINHCKFLCFTFFTVVYMFCIVSQQILVNTFLLTYYFNNFVSCFMPVKLRPF